MANSGDSVSPAAAKARGSLTSSAAPVDNVDIGYPGGFLWVMSDGSAVYVSNGDGTWTSNT
jgi:hypothetical protein